MKRKLFPHYRPPLAFVEISTKSRRIINEIVPNMLSFITAQIIGWSRHCHHLLEQQLQSAGFIDIRTKSPGKSCNKCRSTGSKQHLEQGQEPAGKLVWFAYLPTSFCVQLLTWSKLKLSLDRHCTMYILYCHTLLSWWGSDVKMSEPSPGDVESVPYMRTAVLTTRTHLCAECRLERGCAA